jgi:CheY-like chemotaxis protein
MHGRKTVLVIEDNSLLRATLCEALESFGFEARACEDGASALAVAEQNGFHAVITDYRMPNMDGAEVTRRLRALFPALFIIGVSSFDKNKAFLAAGADAFRLKPYECADLAELINQNVEVL